MYEHRHTRQSPRTRPLDLTSRHQAVPRAQELREIKAPPDWARRMRAPGTSRTGRRRPCWLLAPVLGGRVPQSGRVVWRWRLGYMVAEWAERITMAGSDDVRELEACYFYASGTRTLMDGWSNGKLLD